MRPDMAKCVIEAPRRGSRSRGYKVRKYGKIVRNSEGYDYEGLTRIPSRMGDDKDFSDKLGPLENYLRKNCGRLWDDIYSEIAYHIGRYTRSEGLRHIIDAHLDVETHTWRDESGTVFAANKYGPTVVGSKQFYVEPETGLLRESPTRRYPARATAPVEVIPIEDGKEYRRIAGIWYYQEYGTTIERTPVYFRGALMRYDENVIRTDIRKKQLNKKELRELAKLL